MRPLVVPSLCALMRDQQQRHTSLGIFRPGQITDLHMAPKAPRSAELEAIVVPMDLFGQERKYLETLPSASSTTTGAPTNQTARGTGPACWTGRVVRRPPECGHGGSCRECESAVFLVLPFELGR